MTIKQQINRKAVQWHFSFREPLSHFTNFTPSPPLCYSLKITNYMILREKKIFFVYG